jgi:hypothetical protein
VVKVVVTNYIFGGKFIIALTVLLPDFSYDLW